MIDNNVKTFPGVSDSSKMPDEQPDEAIIEFCEDLVTRAKSGSIRAIAVAMVKNGRLTADGWRRSDHGADCCHELMAAITYLQLRYGNQINATADREAKE
jgi:hypothetical protein